LVGHVRLSYHAPDGVKAWVDRSSPLTKSHCMFHPAAASLSMRYPQQCWNGAFGQHMEQTCRAQITWGTADMAKPTTLRKSRPQTAKAGLYHNLIRSGDSKAQVTMDPFPPAPASGGVLSTHQQHVPFERCPTSSSTHIVGPMQLTMGVSRPAPDPLASRSSLTRMTRSMSAPLVRPVMPGGMSRSRDTLFSRRLEEKETVPGFSARRSFLNPLLNDSHSKRNPQQPHTTILDQESWKLLYARGPGRSTSGLGYLQAQPIETHRRPRPCLRHEPWSSSSLLSR